MPKSIKCVIVDDDNVALTILKQYLEKVPDTIIEATFTDPLEAVEYLQSEKIDLLFLDVEMPDLTGLGLLRSLSNPPLTILTTARKDYAVEGYELNVLDYIVKPVTMERLMIACTKAKKRIGDTVIEKDISPEYIFLKEQKRMVKVFFKDILYLESLKDYVKVITVDKEITTRQQLGYFENLLDKLEFLRIHRSFLVAIDKIEAYNQTIIEVNRRELPIARSYKEDVNKKLKEISNLM